MTRRAMAPRLKAVWNRSQRRETIAMQVEITCTVSLPDTVTDINAVEQAIVAWGQEQMRRVFSQAWQQEQAEQSGCPHCGSEQTVRDGTKPYHLRTVFGTVVVPRQRRTCRQCGRHFQPLDACLHGAGPGRATATVADLAALLGASWPFATAAGVLGQLLHEPVSPEWLRQVAEGHGDEQVQVTQAAAESLLAGQAELPLIPDPVPTQGLVAIDGGFVHQRDGGNMEGKVAVLATGRESVGQERWRLVHRRYAATFASADALAPLTYQAAAELGLVPDAEVVVLGDGANWITELAAWCFPGAERRLDLWHLLHRAGEAVDAERLADDAAAELRHRLTARLRQGDVDAALTLVRDELHGETGDRFAGYLTHQRPWIVDADTLQAQGATVGSGAIEKGVDLVINRRFKGRRGMAWGREAATAIVTLRTMILNQQAAERDHAA